MFLLFKVLVIVCFSCFAVVVVFMPSEYLSLACSKTNSVSFYCFVFPGDGDDDTLLVDTEEKEEKASLSKGERSHLIVWEVSSPE